MSKSHPRPIKKILWKPEQRQSFFEGRGRYQFYRDIMHIPYNPHV
jgi:hypothetical protein